MDPLNLSLSHLLLILTQGIILVYDITNEPSFQHVVKWVSDVDEVRQTATNERVHSLFTLVFFVPHSYLFSLWLCPE